MTDLQTRLSDANPVNDDDLHPMFGDVWHRFENTPAPQRRSSRQVPRTTGTGRPRLARWATLGAAPVAVAVLVVGTTGSGPTSAFAGWSATPTTPTSGQLQAAEAACQQQNPSVASLAPTVADVRGPYSMLVYTDRSTITDCTIGAQGTLMNGVTPAAQTTSVAPNSIEVVSQLSPASPAGQGEQKASELEGQAGAGVTAVTIVLDDGSSIQTTVANGWFAAWWPGSQPAQAAEITTASSTTTQQLNLPAPPKQTRVAPVPAGSTSAAGTTSVTTMTPAT